MTREEIIAVAAAFIVITIMFTIRICILDAKIEKAFDLLEDNTTKPELKDKEEDNNLKSITEILDEERTHDITRKHDACCSSLFKTENEEEDDSEDWKEVYDLLGTIIDNAYVPNKYLISAFNIARKHCGCDS